MFAWLLSLMAAVSGPPTRIRMGSADGCDRSLTDTFEISLDGHVTWTSTVETTRPFALTPDELDRLAHLDRFDADHALPRDPDSRYSQVWFVIERGGTTTRLRIQSARNRELADILLGAEVRDLDR